MRSLITNIRTGLQIKAGNTAGTPPSEAWSRVVIESTVPLKPMTLSTAGSVRMAFPGVPLNMPDAVIPVYDGVISVISAKTTSNGASLEVALEHEVPFHTESVEGIPHRLELKFDRKPAYEVLTGKRLLIDPGHGGRDRGGRGPVDLLEKNVVLTLGHRLRNAALGAGMSPLMTRETDVDLSYESRLETVTRVSSDVLVSLHTGVERDRSLRGAGAAYLNDAGKDLAHAIVRELARKLHLPNRGVWPERVVGNLRVPAVAVEFVTITNWVDEGWVRSCVFLDRAALAILNGLKNYFWSIRTPS